MLNTLTKSLQSMQRHYNEESGKRKMLMEQRAELQRKLDAVINLILIREQAILLLTRTAEVARGQLVQFIEQAVTPPLQAIWGDSRYFKVRQFVHNSKTNEAGADFEVYKPVGKDSGKDVRDNAANSEIFDGGTNSFVPVHPYSASGGGLSDVVSCVLQMTLLEISKPRPGGPLCLDEPSKQLDNVKDGGEEDDANSLAKKQEALAEFIAAYAVSSGRQVLLSSHNATLIRKANRVVKVEPVDAVTCKVVEE